MSSRAQGSQTNHLATHQTRITKKTVEVVAKGFCVAAPESQPEAERTRIYHYIPYIYAIMPAQDLNLVQALLPRSVYDYYAGGAGDELTISENRRAFQNISFLPRVLVPVSTILTTTTIPGLAPLSVPIIVAPMAMQALAHPDGETAVASAAAAHQIPYTLSTFSTTPLEQVAAIPQAPLQKHLLFQVYLYRDRQVTQRLVTRARHAGYVALVLTVDAPRFGRRTRDANNKFHLPSHLKLANFATKDAPSTNTSTALDGFSLAIDANLSFNDIAWLRDVSRLPVWVKGLVRPDDAVKAVDAGADAIVVSNHGARQLDGVIPTMRALPSIVKAVGARVPVLVDSGVRSGEDVVKALALGARAVMLGRPVLWALAQGGKEAVSKYLKDIRDEVELTMALLGTPDIKSITSDFVALPHQSKL